VAANYLPHSVSAATFLFAPAATVARKSPVFQLKKEKIKFAAFAVAS
jgi:hypothetical protein